MFDPTTIPNPGTALRQLLSERYGPEAAHDIIAQYNAAIRRYGRARRVLAARRWLDRYGNTPGDRYDAGRIAAKLLLDNAEEYINGSWRPTRHGATTVASQPDVPASAD